MRKRWLQRSSDRSTSRQIIQQELIDGLRQPGCLFCGLKRAKSRRYIETLLDTAVVDVAQRDAWRLARGLCHWHAGMAKAIAQSAGSLALLYEDVLNHEIRRLAPLTSAGASTCWARLRRGQRLAQRVKRWLHAWHQRDPCPVCRLWQTHEQLCMAVLLDDWHNPLLMQAFAGSSGLCLPHTVRLVAHGGPHRHLAALLSSQQAHLQRLHEELREFIRKQDYRFAREAYGREADAWHRVIDLMAGTSGESELPRLPRQPDA